MKQLLLSAILSAALGCAAAVPLRWTVETSRVTPATFDAIHGETLALEAAFQSYGKPLEMPSDGCCILWQTNGMGSAWWQSPATVASNRVSATFAPAMDPGAAAVTGFLGATGENYRAAFTLRFRHGPGGNPSALPLPTPVIDFATVSVLNPSNAPFAMKGASLGVTSNEADRIARAATSNVVDKAYVEGLGIEAGITAQSATNIVDGIIASSNLATVASVNNKRDKTDFAICESRYSVWEFSGFSTTRIFSYVGERGGNPTWIQDDLIEVLDYSSLTYERDHGRWHYNESFLEHFYCNAPEDALTIVLTGDLGTVRFTRHSVTTEIRVDTVATSNMVNGIVAPATNAALAAANAYTDAKVSGGSRYPRLVWRGHTPYVEDIIDRGGDNISASLNLVRDVVLFTADEDNTRITIVSNTYDTVQSLPSVSLSYSRDYVMFPDVNASTWSPMSVSPDSSDVIILNTGESVAIRCPTENTTLFGYCFSIISGSARVSGELMALASASVPDYFSSTNQFYSMFSRCANLTSAKGLNIAATNTLPYCMAGLFSHCFDLRYPPRELKPKIIAQRAYTSMFSWCTNLVEAPLIMAESAIGERAMWLMFYNCKNLESVSIRHLTSYTGSHSLRAFLSMENVADDNSLNHVEVGFSSWTSQAAYFLETTAVTNGVFVCPSALGTQRATSSNSWRGAPVGWSIVNF